MALKYFSTVADSLPRIRTHPDHRAPHCLLFNRSFDRFITEARVIACPRLSHSRSLSTTRETTDAAIPEVDERERESFDERKERRDVTIALRFFVFHYPLVLFLHFFFFSFSRALCRRCTFLRFRSSRISIPPRFSLLFISISFEFLFVFNTVRYIRVGAMGNCEQSISPLLLFIKFSNIITFFFLRYLKVKCI